MGPEVVMQMAEERAPDGFDRVEDIFRPGELEGVARRYKQVAGFDPEAAQPPGMRAMRSSAVQIAVERRATLPVPNHRFDLPLETYRPFGHLTQVFSVGRD